MTPLQFALFVYAPVTIGLLWLWCRWQARRDRRIAQEQARRRAERRKW